MNKIIRLVTATLLSIAVILPAEAQKFGYIDSQQLLVEHPDVKAADATLKTYTDQLMTTGQDMVTKFEAEYKALLEQAESLAPVQIQEKEAALNATQQSIQAYEVDMQQKIASKREELFSPILAKVKSTIEAIGQEEGYTMIFDVSTGMLLHATPSDDLMAKVKSRLGM